MFADVFDAAEVQLNTTIEDVVELSIDDNNRSAHVLAPHQHKYAIHRAHIDLYNPKQHAWVTVWDKIIGGTPNGPCSPSFSFSFSLRLAL